MKTRDIDSSMMRPCLVLSAETSVQSDNLLPYALEPEAFHGNIHGPMFLTGLRAAMTSALS